MCVLMSWSVEKTLAQYLTGLSCLRVCVSILLLCFLSGRRSMKTEHAVCTRLPGSCVTNTEIREAKRDVKHVMSFLCELFMLSSQPLLGSRRSAGR